VLNRGEFPPQRRKKMEQTNSKVDALMAHINSLSVEDCKSQNLWKPEVVDEQLRGRLVNMKSEEGKYGPQVKLTIRVQRAKFIYYGRDNVIMQLKNLGTKKGDEILLVVKEVKILDNGKKSVTVAVASGPWTGGNGGNGGNDDDDGDEPGVDDSDIPF
jgi:hypothetical protein